MERTEMLEMWNDMWKEGNWVPSWPDSLAGLSAEQAAWTPDANSHSIWQETVHVIFWRRVTLDRIAGKDGPDEQTIAQEEFAAPDVVSEANWTATAAALQQTQETIAQKIQDEGQDVSRIPYHILHDAYHLGRITQLRRMQGTEPKF